MPKLYHSEGETIIKVDWSVWNDFTYNGAYGYDDYPMSPKFGLDNNLLQELYRDMVGVYTWFNVNTRPNSSLY
jgi:hypothetical protein